MFFDSVYWNGGKIHKILLSTGKLKLKSYLFRSRIYLGFLWLWRNVVKFLLPRVWLENEQKIFSSSKTNESTVWKCMYVFLIGKSFFTIVFLIICKLCVCLWNINHYCYRRSWKSSIKMAHRAELRASSGLSHGNLAPIVESWLRL